MLRSLGRMIWKRPKTTGLGLVVLALFGTGVGVYIYALHQWDAARTAVKEGRQAEAERAVDLCLKLWPYSVEVHLLAARRARLVGDFAGAEAQINQCLRLQKGASEDVQVEFLLMRVQTGEVDDVAEELFLHVDNKHRESSLIMETIAWAYMDKVRFGPALQCLDRWIEAAPGEAKPHHWRGWVLERLNDTEGAMTDYRRALELDPGLFAVRLRMAELMLEKSNPPEALVYLEPLSKQYPERPDVMALLGRCRFMQGETDEARGLMETALKKLPDNGPLLITMAKLDLSEGRPVEAEESARRVLKVDPTDAEAEDILAASLRNQGRQKEAAAAQDQHEKDVLMLRNVNRMLGEDAQHPIRDAGAFYEIGALFLRGGQERQAEYWLHRALELDPKHQPSLKALAEYYEGKGDKEKAAAYRRQVSMTDGTPSLP